jgi:carbonic anhydrase/acetyltransferase-like protein (isoleucine patch superfamily)
MPIEEIDGVAPRVHPTAFVHPTAVLIGDVELGARSSVWPGAVLRADYGPIRVGEETSVQDNVVLHGVGSGTFVGARCIVGHLAFIEEAVVEDECLVGVGARILNRSRMRAGSVAAAGTVLVGGMEVPTGMRAQGVPATIVAPPRPMRQGVVDGAAVYVANRLRYDPTLG